MNFEKKATPIPGCFELIPKIHSDERGLFVKTFHEEDFSALGLETYFREEYYSISKRGVLRGMHFQKPPHDHVKVVYACSGRVFDAVIDLRKDSPAFGKYAVFELDSVKGNILYIPKGLAHGFYVMSESAIMVYKVSTVYSKAYDSGVLWASAGIPWPSSRPLISARDSMFPPLWDVDSPF
jgi:dTDP-4-dehydrorhamnose 3,5-epimerase